MSSRNHLRALRWFAILCLLVPLAVYGTVAAVRYVQMTDETSVRLQRAQRIAQEHALKVFDTSDLLLSRVEDALREVDELSGANRDLGLHERLRTLAGNRPSLHSIWIYDRDGRPLASNRAYPVPGDVQVADRPYFQAHRSGREPLHIAEPLLERAEQTPFISISRGRYADGAFEGVISVNLRPEYLKLFHEALAQEEPGAAVTMFREDGVILSRWPDLATAPPRMSTSSPVLSRVLAGQAEGEVRGVSSVDKQDRLLTFAKVGSYPVYVGTGMEVARIRDRWRDEMLWILAFGVPPLVALFFAGRLAIARAEHVLRASEELREETQARHRVEEALLQAQKLEALGRLTGGVAHDFNNALMVISNNLFILRKNGAEAVRPQVESIGRAVDGATKLTRQLLAFSRRQALVPEQLHLEEKLPDLRGLLEPVLGSKIELTIEVAPGTHGVLLDPAEFELAVLNLAINSRDAMPEGGQFVLRAENTMRPGPDGELPFVVLRASDTGTGIPPDVLARVFEPFYTTKPVGRGTGLGLSQIRALCQRAGGDVAIDSEVGRGTVISLFLPAARQEQAPRSPAESVPMHGLNYRVLLVEDNLQVAAALMPVLAQMGCEVRHVDRAAAAIEWLRSEPAPDVLLSDVVMPGELDGLQLAQHVRAHHPEVHVVVMTGYAEQIELIAAQGFVIVPKPCSPQVLAAALQRGAKRSAGTVASGA
jgi:signal transduction histidine kinase/CheY-like chemotaxis protein